MDTAVVVDSIACARVLGIPEVLDRIFGFCTTADNARNACVRQSWRYLALSHVWRNMDSIKPFFQILAPFTRVVQNGAATIVRALNPTHSLTLTHCTISSSLATSLQLVGTTPNSTLAW